MQKIKTIAIGTHSFTLKELPVRTIWDLINNAQAGDSADVTGRFQSMLSLACPELTKEALLDLYPSEIEELWAGFEEVNSAFLGTIRRIGLDVALIKAVKEAVTSSIEQFASSLPAAMVPASGITDTDFSS